MIDLTSYGFKVAGRAPSVEPPPSLKALEHALVAVGAKIKDVTVQNRAPHASDPVMKFTTKNSENFRVFLVDGDYSLHHECGDCRRDQMCSCIYPVAKDKGIAEVGALTNIAKAALMIAKLPSKITLCGYTAHYAKGYELNRTFTFKYQIIGEAVTLTTSLAIGSEGKAWSVYFKSNRDGFFKNRGKDIGEDVLDYVTTDKISVDLVDAAQYRINTIERDLGEPLKELSFLKGLKP